MSSSSLAAASSSFSDLQISEKATNLPDSSVGYGAALYQTIVTIPCRRQLSLLVDAFFDWDDYGREKIGNPIVDQLSGQSKTLLSILISLMLVKEDKNASVMSAVGNLIPSYGATLSPHRQLALMCPRDLLVQMWHHEHAKDEQVDMARIEKLLKFMIWPDNQSMNYFAVEREMFRFGPPACPLIDAAFGAYVTDGWSTKMTMSKHVTKLLHVATAFTAFFNFVPSCLRILKDHVSDIDDGCKIAIFRLLSLYPDLAELDPEFVGFYSAVSFCKSSFPPLDESKHLTDLGEISGDSVYKALALVGRYPIENEVNAYDALFSLVERYNIDERSYLALLIGKIYAHTIIPHLGVTEQSPSSSWTISNQKLSFAVSVSYTQSNKRWKVYVRTKAELGVKEL